MGNFAAAHKIVMVNEGDYANDPTDKGGETYKGIARNKHPQWNGWPIIDHIKIMLGAGVTRTGINSMASTDGTLQALVLSFYKNEFWDALCLDQINNQPICVELYDTSVNMGQGEASLFLQRALNVMNNNGADYPDLKKDGRIGPTTVAVVNNHQYPQNVLKVLNVLQGAHYIEIMEANPSQEKYFRSWFARVSL